MPFTAIAIIDFFDEQDSVAYRIEAPGPDEAYETIADAFNHEFETITFITPDDDEWNLADQAQIADWPAA